MLIHKYLHQVGLVPTYLLHILSLAMFEYDYVPQSHQFDGNRTLLDRVRYAGLCQQLDVISAHTTRASKKLLNVSTYTK